MVVVLKVVVVIDNSNNSTSSSNSVGRGGRSYAVRTSLISFSQGLFARPLYPHFTDLHKRATPLVDKTDPSLFFQLQPDPAEARYSGYSIKISVPISIPPIEVFDQKIMFFCTLLKNSLRRIFISTRSVNLK